MNVQGSSSSSVLHLAVEALSRDEYRQDIEAGLLKLHRLGWPVTTHCPVAAPTQTLARQVESLSRWGGAPWDSTIQFIMMSGVNQDAFNSILTLMQTGMLDRNPPDSSSLRTPTRVHFLARYGNDLPAGVEEPIGIHLSNRFRQLERIGLSLNGNDDHGFSPLHAAAQDGNAASAVALIRVGARVDSRDVDGTTPLHWAARKGNVLIVRALVQAGASLYEPTRDGEWPIDWAANDIVADLLKPSKTGGHFSVEL
ncbi:MAG TPA: ankyrin repeat domain-containing protein [Burkholderiaceae bacterium]|nr:ankyrin repeat domain-containing protein [Burkholderiaceae bacterium]